MAVCTVRRSLGRTRRGGRRVTVSRLRFGTDLIAAFHMIRQRRPAGPGGRDRDRVVCSYRGIPPQRQRGTHTLTHVVTSRRLIDRSNSPPARLVTDTHRPPYSGLQKKMLTRLPGAGSYSRAPNAVMQSALLRDLSMFRSVQRALTASTHATCGSTTGSLPPTYRAEGVLIASPPPRPSPHSRLSPLGCWSSLRLARPRRCCGADCQP